ncbi:hypothetical protein K437DRAFT_293286 [Tilletiaria anomala UBC 951]|uniref:PHD-type domain-containing protein n=1 Tax=Tilletiaria anomala (strain ATCC 24038 / CBS 436.72 / UBC 951) TaxID=1037660 RepID=A0A066WHQ7_TILAU|nr:uncharacterized protein K437DRAFT_293286 [Tilletiaria anomala UBC 951]KDN52058.1 hypothetical protein K437DRAFT_293286 [Tilletiaria anomala UBC 951]
MSSISSPAAAALKVEDTPATAWGGVDTVESGADSVSAQIAERNTQREQAQDDAPAKVAGAVAKNDKEHKREAGKQHQQLHEQNGKVTDDGESAEREEQEERSREADQEENGEDEPGTPAKRSGSSKRTRGGKRGRSSGSKKRIGGGASTDASAEPVQADADQEPSAEEVEGEREGGDAEDGEVEVEAEADEEDGNAQSARSRGRQRKRSSSSTFKELSQLGLGSIGDGEVISGPRRRNAATGSSTSGSGSASGGKTQEGGKRGGSSDGQEGEDDGTEESQGGTSAKHRPHDAVKEEGRPAAEPSAMDLDGNDPNDAAAAAAEDEGLTRCICGSEEETLGLMIQCDVCQAWQHCICMGLQTEEDCPDVYYCEQCRPELHIPLLRALAFLPDQQATASARKKGSASQPTQRELERARGAVAQMAADNATRLKNLSGGEWEKREVAHNFAAARKSGKAPRSVLDALPEGGLEALYAAGNARDQLQHQQQQEQQHHQDQHSGADPLTPGGGGDHLRRSSSRMQEDDLSGGKGSASHYGAGPVSGGGSGGGGGVLGSAPPKRRSTMNSRDSAYGWEPIPPGLLNEDELWDGHIGQEMQEQQQQQAQRRGGAKDRKRKRLGAEDDEEERSPPPEEVESGADGSKRRRTGADDGDVRMSGGRGRGKGKSERSRQPNQYSNARSGKGGDRAGALGGGNALGLNSAAGGGGGSSTSSPSPTKRGGRGGGAAAAVAASSAAGTPSPQTPASLWGLPEHLSHLAPFLPSGDPRELHVQLPSTKGVTSKNQVNDTYRHQQSAGAACGASPLPFQLLELTESCTKIRFPGRRMTMGEMRKRIRTIGEYVTSAQLEAVERDRRRKRLGLPPPPPASESGAASAAGSSSNAFSTGTTTPAQQGLQQKDRDGATTGELRVAQDTEMNNASNEEAGKADDGAHANGEAAAATNEAEAAKGKEGAKVMEITQQVVATAAMIAGPTGTTGSAEQATRTPTASVTPSMAPMSMPASMQMLDDLMREIISFQQRFGSLPGSLVSALHAQALAAARGMTPGTAEA